MFMNRKYLNMKYLKAVSFITVIAFSFVIMSLNADSSFAASNEKNTVNQFSILTKKIDSEITSKVKILVSHISDDNPPFREDFEKMFKNSIIVGDSLTEGIYVYNFLDKSKVLADIGASIRNGESLFLDAGAKKPENAFFAFGMNDLGGYNGNTSKFIKDYKNRILKFSKASSKSRIFVCAVQIPSDKALSENPIYKKYDDFNKGISKMCKKNKWTFCDTTSIIKINPELHAPDGIHMDIKYYPRLLDLLASYAGIL